MEVRLFVKNSVSYGSNKPFIQCRGAGPSANSRECTDRLDSLREEMVMLEQQEAILDQHKQWVQQSIHNITDEVNNHKYPLPHSKVELW